MKTLSLISLYLLFLISTVSAQSSWITAFGETAEKLHKINHWQGFLFASLALGLFAAMKHIKHIKTGTHLSKSIALICAVTGVFMVLLLLGEYWPAFQMTAVFFKELINEMT